MSETRYDRKRSRFASWVWATTASVSSVSALVAVIGCGEARDADAEPNTIVTTACTSEVRQPVWLRARDEVAANSDPSILRAETSQVIGLERLDLNCDGRPDLVAQVRLPDADRGTELFLVAFVAEASGWTEVLRVRSLVAGVEGVSVAADLNGDGHLDLLSLGSDEGGVIPRMFISAGKLLREIAMPVTYRLRQEADWASDCWIRLAPALLPDGSIQLARETLSPSGAEGHGTDCHLPLDTLTMRGDSLVRRTGS